LPFSYCLFFYLLSRSVVIYIFAAIKHIVSLYLFSL
jgi:hypothetical protein